AGRAFERPVFARLVLRLKARIAAAEGGAEAALKIVNDAPRDESDDDTKMLAAGLMAETGDRTGAQAVWREIVSRGTNASERAFAVASANLGEEEPLREAFRRATSAETRRLAGYGLGRALLAGKETLDEGASLIRSLVREAPDAEGAREGLTAVADAFFGAGRLDESVAVYRQTFEIWPDAAKRSDLQSGLGWALARLGRRDEALEAFARAEETARTDDERASAIVKQGDMLAEGGKRDESLLKYRSVLEQYPETDAAARIKDLVRIRELEDRGRELYRAYRFAEAREVFREVAAKDSSQRPRMEYLEILCQYGQGLDEEAAAHARQIAAGSPDAGIRSAATLWLAKYAYNRGEWAESRRLFASYAALAPDAGDAPDALVWSARAAFAENDFQSAVQTATALAEKYPAAPSRVAGFLVQGEALIELARFDEAVLVLERVALDEGATPADRLRARLLGADALFAMGADNPVRYQEALEAYRTVKAGEVLDPSAGLLVSYKIAKTLEKLKRTDEAVDRYYADVVLTYRDGRARGLKFDDESRAAFSRAAFRLADEFESRGRRYQAVHVLELVAASGVPAAAEAEKRIHRIQRKGNFL
ncbi:MAG: tetratricopeptide repeat protein, partial [Kiritimatiellae bacterium]|nr:tetratricopeptide repeat protein [Kiritimatiellia bacterium]